MAEEKVKITETTKNLNETTKNTIKGQEDLKKDESPAVSMKSWNSYKDINSNVYITNHQTRTYERKPTTKSKKEKSHVHSDPLRTLCSSS